MCIDRIRADGAKFEQDWIRLGLCLPVGPNVMQIKIAFVATL